MCGTGLVGRDSGLSSVLAVLGLCRVRKYVHHVTDTTSGQPVQAGTDTLDGDDVQVSCAGVVCTVHDGTAAVLSVPHLYLRLVRKSCDFVGSRVGFRRAGVTYTGRPRVILSLPPGAPRL